MEAPEGSCTTPEMVPVDTWAETKPPKIIPISSTGKHRDMLLSSLEITCVPEVAGPGNIGPPEAETPRPLEKTPNDHLPEPPARRALVTDREYRLSNLECQWVILQK